MFQTLIAFNVLQVHNVTILKKIPDFVVKFANLLKAFNTLFEAYLLLTKAIFNYLLYIVFRKNPQKHFL